MSQEQANKYCSLCEKRYLVTTQDAKTAKIVREETLKEVGEWLDKQQKCGFADTPLRCVNERDIAKLKQGEMK
jgi:hypothetical protein